MLINETFLKYLSKVVEYQSAEEIQEAIELLKGSICKCKLEVGEKIKESVDKGNFGTVGKYAELAEYFRDYENQMTIIIEGLKEGCVCEESIEDVLKESYNKENLLMIEQNEQEDAVDLQDKEQSFSYNKLKYKDLIELGILKLGETLYIKNNYIIQGQFLKNGEILYNGTEMSINAWVDSVAQGGAKNAYKKVAVKRGNTLVSLDDLRKQYNEYEPEKEEDMLDKEKQLLSYKILGQVYRFKNWKDLFITVLNVLLEEDEGNIRKLKLYLIPESRFSFASEIKELKKAYQQEYCLNNGEKVYMAMSGLEIKTYLEKLFKYINHERTNKIEIEYIYD